MTKTMVLETINYYMEQAISMANRCKSINPISMIEALRYIEEEVRQLNERSYNDGYQKGIEDAKNVIMGTKKGFKI